MTAQAFRRRGRLPRRGLASIELVMVFPCLVVLVAVLISIGSAAVTRAHVAVGARESAWEKRDSGTDDKNAAAKFYQDNGKTPPSAEYQGDEKLISLISSALPYPDIIESKFSRPVKVYPKNVLGLFASDMKTAQAHHAVLGGSWDYRFIDSPTHDRLTPSPAFLSFGDLSKLGGILDGITGFLKSTTKKDPGSVGPSLDKSIAQIQKQIDDTVKQIQDLETKLKSNPDDKDLQKQLKDAQAKLKKLQDGLASLQKLKNTSGG